MTGETKTALALVLAAAFAVPALVLLTGQTFGQRCARAYPTNPARAELCVYNLNEGKAP